MFPKVQLSPLLFAALIANAEVPIQLSIAYQPNVITLNWTGGYGPFQVQKAFSLDSNVWENVGNATIDHSLALSPSDVTAFFRISEPDVMLPRLADGRFVVPTKQILSGVGEFVETGGRPVDLVLSPDGGTVYVKSTRQLMAVDAASWTWRQGIDYPGHGAAMHGIAVSKDGSHVYVTGAVDELYDFAVATDGTMSFSRTISLLTNTAPCGVALSPDGMTAYVCLSLNNVLAVVDLSSGTVSQEISVGVAPWDVVLSSDGNTAYVSDWGGRHPEEGDLTALSTGTPVVVDERGIASSGAVSFVSLLLSMETAQVPTGLHPSDLELSQDGNTLYVVAANSDTVTVIDTPTKTVKETVQVRPDPMLPFGSAANGLVLSRDSKTLYVANGGNNAIAVVELPNEQHTNSLLQGFIPTYWYPGAVIADEANLYVADVKGYSWGPNANNFYGRSEKIPIPSPAMLSNYTAQVLSNTRVPEILQTQTPARAGRSPVPVPENVGEPSVFQHVLYIIKENKTYDSVFGDLPRGNADSNLCLYPEFVTPNHHALAAQFVLLDNFYCNGVLSIDGHSWSTEGNASDYLEKSWGGFSRSGDFDGDALVYSSSGFIWNNVLERGLSFRNHGEMVNSFPQPDQPTWLQVYSDYKNQTGQIWYSDYVNKATLKPHTSTNAHGWNLSIPDEIRADDFLKEFSTAQSNGFWPNFNILFLPSDHTAGETPGFPTPSAMVADNDLALGRVVEAVTKSIFWTNTVIFVIEDDPGGIGDHVDGHRSICLVISPYTKRGQLISTFYNQTGVLHTMEQIMGVPPMNQLDAMSPLMSGCFTNVPNFSPYTSLPNNIPLDTMNPGTTTALTAEEHSWAEKSMKLDFTGPDKAEEDTLNRAVWHSIKGNARYPSECVGAHGKGLKKLGLMNVKTNRKDDDD